MKRLPLIPTLIVGLACLTMIGLGIWQLQRARWKDQLFSQYDEAPRKPEMAFPILATEPERLLFRRAGALCLEPKVDRTVFAGRKGNGLAYRHIMRCRTGAEGPGFLVDIGWAADPRLEVIWSGGPVTGVISQAPSESSLISRLTGRAPPIELMLIAREPAPGLQASAPPSVEDIPNNHLAYAVQWFLFAGVAAAIYLIALRRRTHV